MPSNRQVGEARADSITDWVSRVRVRTSGDTVWRKATEDDWWTYKQLGYLRDALRMGVAPPARCRYKGPNWYGEENLQYLTSIRHWAVDPGHRLVVDDPHVPSMWEFLVGGRGFGKRRFVHTWPELPAVLTY